MHIGLRSTRLETSDNHELIVPNKTLLDEQVTNLTLSDNFVHTFVQITTERDVDVQKSKWKLLEVAFGNPLVVKSPRPVVILKEIDTYWLVFEIHFWLQYNNFIKCAMVQSEIMEGVSDFFKPPPEKGGSVEPEKSEDPPNESGEGSPASEAAPPVPSTVVAGDIQRITRAAAVKQMRKLGGRWAR
jgi:hypothetical protein